MIELRSPVARAVVPVLGGIGVLAAIALLTWAMAAYISRGEVETSERLAPSTLNLGSVEARADDVAANGPILIPGLNTTIGERTLVLDHEGRNAADGWIVYYAYPADRDATCPVEQVRGTATFVDCEGRELDVTDLAPPTSGVRPVVESRERLLIDLRGITENGT
ncbi:MAG: hypothetical protein MUE78_10505 [Ilumatobacteraceae bacterium]|nr:hypothetical protein [Ilumatobacteraceae bacterium]